MNVPSFTVTHFSFKGREKTGGLVGDKVDPVCKTVKELIVKPISEVLYKICKWTSAIHTHTHTNVFTNILYLCKDIELK